MDAPAPELLIVGRLRKPHGIRGALVVEPLTDAPDAVFAAGRRLLVGTPNGDPDPAGRTLVVETARAQPDGSFIVQFSGVADRTAAERWRDRYLLAQAADLEPPADGEVYVHELPGMTVELPSGESLGTVAHVLELPQGLALEIAHGARVAILPFHAEFVRHVDRAARRIIAVPPNGLFE
ncbi:MAG TPA: ribosome maturation factor RimM [Gemmatimonadaceae bacterium]|nr:ribosome maturation factor RimM [Gemmatimonadaceae bacterium]